MFRNHKKAGFTLLELMIVILILSIAMAAVVQLMISASKTYDAGQAFQDMNVRSQKLMAKIRRDLRSASVIQTGGGDYTTGGPYDTTWYIDFQVPIGRDDGSGNIVYSEVGSPSEVMWGADGTQDRAIRYRFDKDENSLVDEVTDGVDYNGDGDKLDIYYLGSISRQILDTESNSRAVLRTDVLTGQWFLFPKVAAGHQSGTGKLDLFPDGSDNMDDPLFVLVDEDQARTPNNASPNVRVSLLMFKRLRGGQFVINRKDSVIYPINQETHDQGSGSGGSGG